MKKENIIDTISIFTESLINYRKILDANPESDFYKGIVKNTEEYISELNDELLKLS